MVSAGLAPREGAMPPLEAVGPPSPPNPFQRSWNTVPIIPRRHRLNWRKARQALPSWSPTLLLPPARPHGVSAGRGCFKCRNSWRVPAVISAACRSPRTAVPVGQVERAAKPEASGLCFGFLWLRPVSREREAPGAEGRDESGVSQVHAGGVGTSSLSGGWESSGKTGERKTPELVGGG